MRTAFVFAGGGSLGAIQVGALRELLRAGERPDFVVGASVGALNACFFAARPDEQGVDALDLIWRGLKRRHIFPFTARAALEWLGGGESIFDSSALRALVGRNLALRNLEDAEIAAHVLATNLRGEPVCLSQGPAVEAVLASAAMPIAFPAIEIGDEHLMDGAIAGNTPILAAEQLGATRIVVLQTGYACSFASPPKGAVARGMHALTLLISNQMQRDLQLLRGRAEVHVTPHLCPLDVSPFNFERSGELIERAAEVTHTWIAAGGLNRQDHPGVFAHNHAKMAAIGGYDVVSYFAGPPIRGSPDFAAEHDGRIYHFATASNRDVFVSAPERYLPQYGGHCAFAMAQRRRVRGDPLVYLLVDGRLYFNLDRSAHANWRRTMNDGIRRADNHWRSLITG